MSFALSLLWMHYIRVVSEEDMTKEPQPRMERGSMTRGKRGRQLRTCKTDI
jgi:hypothetical protein